MSAFSVGLAVLVLALFAHPVVCGCVVLVRGGVSIAPPTTPVPRSSLVNQLSLPSTLTQKYMNRWESFFSDLTSFLRLTAERESLATQNVVEATLLKLDNYISVLRAIMGRIQSSISDDFVLEEVERDVSRLLTSLHDLQE